MIKYLSLKVSLLSLSISKFKVNPLIFIFEKGAPHHKFFPLKSLGFEETLYAKNLIKWIIEIQNFDGSFSWIFPR